MLCLCECVQPSVVSARHLVSIFFFWGPTWPGTIVAACWSLDVVAVRPSSCSTIPTISCGAIIFAEAAIFASQCVERPLFDVRVPVTLCHSSIRVTWTWTMRRHPRDGCRPIQVIQQYYIVIWLSSSGCYIRLQLTHNGTENFICITDLFIISEVDSNLRTIGFFRQSFHSRFCIVE